MTDKRSKKSKKFKDSLCKEIGRLNSQLKDQEKLLRRYGQKQQNKERYFGSENQGEIKGEANEAPYTAFAVYTCLRQSYFSRVVRRLKFQMKAIIERMKVAPSIKASIELFEEAVKNNDLSVFKSAVVLNEEEWKRIEHQEHVLWSIKSNGNSFLVHFLNSIVEQRGDLANSEDVSLVQRIIQILEQLVNTYRMNATGEPHGHIPLNLTIKIQNWDILKAFIPLHNQGIVKDNLAQETVLYSSQRKENVLTSTILPLAVAISESVHTDLIDLILDEVYEPHKETIEAVLNSRPAYYSRSILNYELSWIKSIINKYQIDVSTLSDHIFCIATISNSSSTAYDMIQYFYSQGLQMRKDRKVDGGIYDHFTTLYSQVPRLFAPDRPYFGPYYGIQFGQSFNQCNYDQKSKPTKTGFE